MPKIGARGAAGGETIRSSHSIYMKDSITTVFQTDLRITCGHLVVITVDPKVTPESLMNLISQETKNGIRFLAYCRFYSFCKSCSQIFTGMVPACTKCASDNVTRYGRSSAIYVPLTLWPEGKKTNNRKSRVFTYLTCESGRVGECHSFSEPLNSIFLQILCL